jgi:hypothetical protein
MVATIAAAYGPYALSVAIVLFLLVAFGRGWVVSAPFAEKEIERNAAAQQVIIDIYKGTAETAIEALRVEQSTGATERAQLRAAMVELIEALRKLNEAA